MEDPYSTSNQILAYISVSHSTLFGIIREHLKKALARKVVERWAHNEMTDKDPTVLVNLL
jgi:hypothetical protein